MRTRLWLVAMLLTPAAVLADPQPAIQPLRDVDVTYRVPIPDSAGNSLLQRLRWSAASHRQRVDLPTSGNWMVLDFAARRMQMVRDDSRQVIDLPAPANVGQPNRGEGFSQAGNSIVAGLACTQWRTIDNRGNETVACYTADGVLLRASAGSRVLMEAVSVKYQQQPGSIFDTPAEYSHQVGNR